MSSSIKTIKIIHAIRGEALEIDLGKSHTGELTSWMKRTPDSLTYRSFEIVDNRYLNLSREKASDYFDTEGSLLESVSGKWYFDVERIPTGGTIEDVETIYKGVIFFEEDITNSGGYEVTDPNSGEPSFNNQVLGADEKTTPANEDWFGILDSEEGFITKKLSWLNIKNTLKAFFNTIYLSVVNLSYTPSASQGTITNSGGLNAIIPVSNFENAGLQTPSDKQLDYNNSSTGLISFEGLSINSDNTKFDVGALKGWFIDNVVNPEEPTKTYLDIPASTANVLINIATQNVTYIAINSNGELQQSSMPFQPEQLRDWISLGTIVHSNRVNINAINNQPNIITNPGNQLSDLMESIGFFNITGNVISSSGINLNINKSVGNVFKQGSNFVNNNKDPHTLSLPALIAPNNIRYRLRGGLEYLDTSNIDPNNWDDAGVLSPVLDNQWSVQRIFIFQSNLIRIQYGQAIYSSKAQAIEAIQTEAFITEKNLAQNGLLRSLLIIRGDTTNLTDLSRALFIEVDRFGSVVGLGGTNTTDLQKAYNNSTTPKIITNDTLGAVAIQRGSLADEDNVLEIKNGLGEIVARITGDGEIFGTNLKISNWNSATHYLGDFNVGTLSPAISDKDYVLGDEFKVIGAASNGTIADFGSGNITLYNDDILLHNGTAFFVKSRLKSVFFPAPNINELVPDTYSPSTTGDFILRGSYFTEDMTIVVEGHSYNYWTFVSSNEVVVNLTTSATEGEYDVTLNNGIEATFKDILQIVSGTVYQPTPLNWIDIVNNLNVSEIGAAKFRVLGSPSKGEWNQIIDYTKDFSIQFNLSKSLLGFNITGEVNFLYLKSVIDNANIFTLALRKDAGTTLNFRVSSETDVVSYANSLVGNAGNTIEQNFDLLAENIIEFRYISGIMYFYYNNILKKAFTHILSENLNLAVDLKFWDLSNIKYIDLTDTGGGYTDYSKLISQFTNDIGYLKTDLSSLGAYADDTAAASGGVEIGFAYINSSTGALHRRLT